MTTSRGQALNSGELVRDYSNTSVNSYALAPHRVLILALRPGDEIRYAASILNLLDTPGQSQIAHLDVLFTTKDGKELPGTSLGAGNRAAEAHQVLSAFGIDEIMYLGLGAARAPQTAPKALSSSGTDAFSQQPVLALVDDMHAALRQSQPDTIVLALPANEVDATDADRLIYITNLAADRAEQDGIGRASVFSDGSPSGTTGILVLRSVLTSAAMRNRNRALAQVTSSTPEKQVTVPARNVQMHLSSLDSASAILDSFRRYTSRFTVKNYGKLTAVVDSDETFIPGGSDSFIEVRSRAQPLAAPATDLDQWQLFAEAVKQPSSKVNWISAVFGLFGGVIAGLVLTLWHQVTLAGMPTGLIGSLLMIVALLVGMRLQRVPAVLLWAVAGGFALGVSWAAMAGQSGDILVPANMLGVIWAYGAPILAALIAVWPRRRTKVR